MRSRIRIRTPLQIIGYGLYLYFLGLSFRNTANKALSFLFLVKISHVSIWNWIQKYKPHKLKKKKNIDGYLINETAIKVGSELIWLWVAIWYPQACRFLKLVRHLHSHYEKSLIERTIQYIKDRVECFDDYFPCKKNKCTLNHLKQWLYLFIDQHNGERIS